MSTPTEVLNQIVAYCKEVGAARNGLDKALTKIQTIAEEALHPSESAGVLPADNEVSKWFEENIDKGCSASSAIYKFRLWLKELNVGAGVKGAVWVKASKGLPKEYGHITWRWLDKEAAYIGYVENRGFIYDTGGASVDPLYYNEIEWLDEGVGVKCAVWVKATERLPDKGGIDNKVIVRGVLNEQGYANHFFVAYGFRNFSKEKQEMYFEYGSKSFLTNDLEWLDESPSLAPDQAGKEDAVAEIERRNKIIEDNLKLGMRLNMPGISAQEQEKTWQEFKQRNNL